MLCCKRLRKGRTTISTATFLEIYVLQVCSEKFFTEISHPRKWGKWLGSRKLPRPHRHPAHRATPAARVCVRRMWASKETQAGCTQPRHTSDASSQGYYDAPELSSATQPGIRAGWAMDSWNGSRSFTACFRALLGLCLFTSVKLIYVQEVLLKIWWKLNTILAFLYTGQSLPSNNFVLILLSKKICASGRVLRLQSLFLMLSLFGVLCMCFKWDGLELMDGVLPSVFYSLKISKCIHFICIS